MKHFLVFCLLLFTGLSATAQNVVFTAEASASTIGIEDQMQVSFTIENAEGLQGISQPVFPDFQVLAGPYRSQSSNISFNGNQRIQTTSISLTYVLQPTKTGNLNIPSIMAKDAAGHSYQSNALSIKVVKGSLAQQQRQNQRQRDPFFDDDPFGGDPFAAIRQHQAQMQQLLQQLQQQAQGPAANQAADLPQVSEGELGKNIFIRVNVDRTQVRLGEQVTATYKLYSRIPMHAVLSKLPSLNGFWTQDFDLPKEQKPQQETLDGVTYQTFTLKKSALFPQQTGTLVLDAAEAKGVARVMDRSNPYNPYAYKDVQINLKSTPVNITVKTLPAEGKPESFSGAVGSFRLNSKIDKTSLSTDETANLSLDISGTGNLKLIEAPAIKLPNGLDIFEPQILDTITSRSTTISGNKIFSYAIAPRIVGDYVIPAIPFSYFDGKTGKYVTLYTEEVKLHVTAGKNYKKENSQAKNLTDIHSISSRPEVFPAISTPLFFRSGYLMAYLLATVAFLLFLVWKKRRDTLSGNTSLLKNKYANKIALKRLKTAKQYLDQQKTGPFYEEISRAIWLYLSDKLNIPLSKLSKETASEAISARRNDPGLLQQASRIIDDCELSLYAPGGGAQKMQQTYNDTIQLIAQLEETFKKK